MPTMWEIFQAARPKLGPVLFQLPPTFSAAPEAFAFVRILPNDMRAAFEFRHPSWFAPEVLRLWTTQARPSFVPIGRVSERRPLR